MVKHSAINSLNDGSFSAEVPPLVEEISQYIKSACLRAGVPPMHNVTDYILVVGCMASELQSTSNRDERTVGKLMMTAFENLGRELESSNNPSSDYGPNIEIASFLPSVEKLHRAVFHHSGSLLLADRVNFWNAVMEFSLTSALTDDKDTVTDLRVFFAQNPDLFKPLTHISVCFAYEFIQSFDVELRELAAFFLCLCDIICPEPRLRLGKDSLLKLPEAEWHALWEKHAQGTDLRQTFSKHYNNLFAQYNNAETRHKLDQFKDFLSLNPNERSHSINTYTARPLPPFLDCIAVLLFSASYKNLQAFITVINDQNNKHMQTIPESAFSKAYPSLRQRRLEAVQMLLVVDTTVFREPGQLLSSASKLRIEAERLNIFGPAENVLFATIYNLIGLLDEAPDSAGKIIVMIDEGNTLEIIKPGIAKLEKKIAETIAIKKKTPVPAQKRKKKAKKPTPKSIEKATTQTQPHRGDESISPAKSSSASSSHTPSTVVPIVHNSIRSNSPPLPSASSSHTPSTVIPIVHNSIQSNSPPLPSASSSHTPSTVVHIVHNSIRSNSPPLPSVADTQIPPKQHTQYAPATTFTRTNIRQIKLDQGILEETVKANNHLDRGLIKIALQASEYGSRLHYQNEIHWVNIEGFRIPTRLRERSQLVEVIDLMPYFQNNARLAQVSLNSVDSSKRPKVNLRLAAKAVLVAKHLLKHWPAVGTVSGDNDKPDIRITCEELVLRPYSLILQGCGRIVKSEPEDHPLAFKFRGEYIILENACYYIWFRYQKDWPLSWAPVSYGPYELGLDAETVARHLTKFVVRI